MEKARSKAVRCISCELACQLFPYADLRAQYCCNTEFAIWPEGNSFLKRGIIERLLLSNKNHLSKGFIFVDFSLPNLRAFSQPQWLDWLANSGMYIVIIADSSLTPLANYWFLNNDNVHGVIYADDDVLVQQQSIHRLFTGRRTNIKRGRTLNAAEFLLLNSFISGAGIQQEINISSINKIYAYKRSLESKLGQRIQTILLNIL